MNTFLKTILGIIFFYIYFFIFMFFLRPIEIAIDYNDGYFFYLYINTWINLVKQILSFENFGIDRLVKELPYLIFIFSHFVFFGLFSKIIAILQFYIKPHNSKIFLSIFFIPLIVFEIIDKIFPKKND